MSDIIHLLPDSIASQIAAGEVIQRPSSVVKELVENAIDAGAHNIYIRVKDAGRSLIQVIDDGKGMSPIDARMAFERHATSKIEKADDLFSLHTMGFRGEALASIAAVSQVELKTKTENEELGTSITIAGSKIENQQTVMTGKGSVFSVKNIFFNVPARRKFLKSNETELRNIISELERITLVYPEINFSFHHNDNLLMDLPESVLRQRIANIFGKSINNQLLHISIETSLVNLSGFIGTPASSKKRNALEFFFVNGRYMRHPYFHKAVTEAFEPFVPAGNLPNYFIYLNVDPGTIDVNIHPTKTEIKFENEREIWPIICAAVREAIAKTNSIPTIEFDKEKSIDIPVYKETGSRGTPPEIHINKNYNPFQSNYSGKKDSELVKDWELLYQDKQSSKEKPEEGKNLFSPEEIDRERAEETDNQFQFKGRYLVTALKSGLVVIDQRRAHIRILYDEYKNKINTKKSISQRLLFPGLVHLTVKEATVMPYISEDLKQIGFDLSEMGDNSYSVNAAPSCLDGTDPVKVLQNMIDKALETGCEVKDEIVEALILSLSVQSSVPYGKTFSKEEINDLISRLFSSSNPNYTPDGKKILYTIPEEEIEKQFR